MTVGASAHPRSIWWDPRQPDWWVALLFAVGSSCFASASVPAFADLVGLRAVDTIYFVGSLFFTSAAWLQLLVSVGAVRPGVRSRRAARWRTLVRTPRDAGWWAGVVQFAGTLLFNVSTYSALDDALTVTEEQRRVWAPDALGSIAFLIASTLAFAAVRRPWLRWSPRDLDWSVATLNLVGSVAFGVSAVAAKVVDAAGDLRDAQLANTGTFIGAVCFLVGAILLVPEEAAHDVEPAHEQQRSG